MISAKLKERLLTLFVTAICVRFVVFLVQGCDEWQRMTRLVLGVAQAFLLITMTYVVGKAEVFYTPPQAFGEPPIVKEKKGKFGRHAESVRQRS